MPVATSTERDPGGDPIAGARVVVRLLTSPGDPFAPAYVPGDDYTVSGEWETTTDADGVWSTPDVPATADIVPANSVYVADMLGPHRHRFRRTFLMPAGAGPHRVEDNLADPPADMPTLLSDVVAEEIASRVRATGVAVGIPGGVDDTALVVAARTAAGIGGKVVFGPGDYVVEGLEASVEDQHWDVWPGARIRTKDGADTPTIDITADGVTIDGGGTIDGNRTNQTDTDIGHSGLGTTACVRIISRSNVTVRDLTITAGGSNGVLIDAGTNIVVKNNRVSDCSPTGNSKQIMVVDVVGSSTNVRIRGNTIDAVSRTNGCISILNQAEGRTISNLHIKGNTCLVGKGGGDVSTLAIELFTVPGGFIRDATVRGNTVQGPSDVVSTDLVYGISCGGNSAGPTDGNTQVAITGNTIRNCPALAIEIIGSGIAASGNTTYNSGPIAVLAVTVEGGVRAVSVTGNTILDSIDLSYCLRIDGGTNGIYGLTVTGNTVRNNAAGYALYINGKVNGSTFTANTFTDLNGPAVGILEELVDSVIANNIIDLTGVGGDTADAILLNGAGIVGVSIHGNVIKGAPRMGIYGNAVTDHVSIVGNRITGCDYGIFVNTATNLLIASNDVHDNTVADYLTAGSTFVTHVVNGAGG